MNAPIALFAYNRPQHLQQVINGLAKNKEAKSSDLIIYSDAPRIADDESGVTDVRKLIKSVIGFRSIKTVYIKKNLGVANSIISGVTQVVNKFKTIIVLEDDTVPSPFFFAIYERSPLLCTAYKLDFIKKSYRQTGLEIQSIEKGPWRKGGVVNQYDNSQDVIVAKRLKS